MRLTKPHVAILTLVLAVACGGDGSGVDPGPPPPAPTGTVAGRVTAEGTGLRGIVVTLSGAAGQSATTGADGSYRFTSVPAGSHVVTLSNGVPADVVFASTTQQVTISSAGQQVRADFAGQYLRTSTLRGAVLSVAAGDRTEPIEGAAILLTGVEAAADTSDANGRYEFAALRPGEYTVSLADAGEHFFESLSHTTTLSAGEVQEHDFVGAGELFVATDSLGFAREAVPYSARLAAFGGSGREYAWSLTEGSTLPEGLELASGGTIGGTPMAVGATEFGVRVTDSAMREASATLSLRVCEGALGLEVGDYEVLTGDLEPCGFFIQAPADGAYYRVTLVETREADRQAYEVELGVEGAGSTSAAMVAATVAPAGTRQTDPVAQPRGEQDQFVEAERARARAHARLRRIEAGTMRRLIAERPQDMLRDRSGEAARAARAGAGTIRAPEEYDFRLGNPYSGNSCRVETTVTARLVAENDHLAVYEYATSSSAEDVRQLVDFYADHGAEVIERWFGGVSDVNGDGRVNILLRPDDAIDALAYVWANDLTFSAEACAASNEMELIHFGAGLVAGIGEENYSALGILAHEMKHVSSLYKRARAAARGAGNGFQPLWIEEGTAELAKEMSSRLAWERVGGPAAGARLDGTALREVAEGEGGAVRAAAFGLFAVLARAIVAISSDPTAVAFAVEDDAGNKLGDFYGSGWHFHRFLLDWVANGGGPGARDADLMRELNDSLTATGVAGIEAVTGRSMEDLLVEHAVAMTFAGSEDSAAGHVPRFVTYDFPGATGIFRGEQLDPPGVYPWPVTVTDAAGGGMAVALDVAGTRTFSGVLFSGGFRMHDFRARAEGDAAAFHPEVPGTARVIVARIPDPGPEDS